MSTSLSPYNRSVRVMTASNAPATSLDGVRGGNVTASGLVTSAQPAFNGAGEINASSTLDLMRTYGSLMNQSASKTRMAMGDPAKKEARTAALKQAFADKSGPSFQKLGDTVATAIMETMRRHGFTRRCLVEDTPNGPVTMIRVSRMDVAAQIVVDKETVTTQDVRSYWFTAPEFSIDTMITIGNKDLAQVGPELMDEKFNDGLVATWTKEDRLTRQMYLNTQGVYNTPFGFTSFTPAVLAAMKNQVEAWGLTATTLLISYDIWNDIISNTDWQNFFSPLEKHDLALEGRLGRLMGMEIITDGFLYDNLRVLQRGEVFVLGAPATLGKVVQRQALEATAVDRRVLGEFSRGWALEQIQAMAVVNSMAVGYGQRL